MARSVADAALMLSVMAGPDPHVPISISEPGEAFAAFLAPDDLKDWRVAYAPTLGGLFRVDSEVERVTSTAAARFAELGCQVDDATPDLRAAPDVINVLRAMRTVAVHQAQVATANQLHSAWLREFLTRSSHLSLADVARAESQRSVLWQTACAFFETYRLLLLPTTQFVSFPADRPYPGTH